jgi:hypothetical protein
VDGTVRRVNRVKEQSLPEVTFLSARDIEQRARQTQLFLSKGDIDKRARQTQLFLTERYIEVGRGKRNCF